MRRTARELTFAFLAWLAPFAMSVCVYHLRQRSPWLFESVMNLTLVGTTVVLGCAELRRCTRHWVLRGLAAGCLWMAANWLLDAVMFGAGPMKMPLARYVSEIGPAYLILPLITTGLGVAAARASGKCAPALDAGAV